MASYFCNKENAKEMMRLLEDAGFRIIHDWTNEDTEGMEGHTLREYMRGAAYNDHYGASVCDLFVLLHENAQGCSMFTELGFAVAGGAYIIVVGGATPARDRNVLRNIFYYLPCMHHVETMQQAQEKARWAKQAGEL